MLILPTLIDGAFQTSEKFKESSHIPNQIDENQNGQAHSDGRKHRIEEFFQVLGTRN